jgi:hypothetical protein
MKSDCLPGDGIFLTGLSQRFRLLIQSRVSGSVEMAVR